MNAAQESLNVKEGEKIDLARLGIIANTIAPHLKRLKDEGFEPLSKSMRIFVEQIRAMENLAAVQKGIANLENNIGKAVKEIRKIQQAAPAAIEGLRNMGTEAVPILVPIEALGNEALKIGPKAQDGAGKAVSALQTIGPAAANQIPQVNALASALQNLAAQRAAAATVATGGQIPAFLAAGGPTQSRGTDTVPVQAAPGEFFVNAASSRRFIPELTAINQGRSPEPRNNAQTTNNSFSGDININVPAGTSVNGRSVAADIRRELRRKTSSLS